MKTYAEMNEGKPMRLYKITKPGAKHARAEGGSEERPNVVVYGAPDPGNQFQIVGEILLTDADAAKYQRVLGLVAVLGTGQNVQTAPVAASTAPTVRIPADWAQLSPDTRKELAHQISGEVVGSVKKADKIIAEHLSDAGNTDSK